MRTAVVVAGGTGDRLGREGGKQLTLVAGEPVLSHTLRALEACPAIDAVVVVVHPDRVEEYRRAAIDPLGMRKLTEVVPGGASRSASVLAGLAALPDGCDVVAIHDGARPLVSPGVVAGAIESLESDLSCAGVVVGHPSFDTLKVVDADGTVVRTADRSAVWAAQTPQVFRAAVLRAAYDQATRDGWQGTDDASYVERAGGTVRMYSGPRDNIKVTVPEDLVIADLLLGREREGADVSGLRMGVGYDVHAFADDRTLVLGGVVLPGERGLAGHSDADVLAHAVMDGILGALRAGDIGRLFPDTDPAFAGISSMDLLGRVGQTMREAGYRLIDADTVLVLEAPRIAPYREAMREALASALGVDVSLVGVKATTTEGLGFAGRREGVAAHAVVLLERIDR